MTIEEKLEEAKKLYKNANADQRYVLECLFPQLQESEDEKIRKTLIEYFNAYPKDYYGDLKKSHILAWLEKQAEKETTYDKDMLGAIEYCIKNNRPLEKEHIAWLEEKKGEQKSANKVEPRFKIDDKVIHKETGKIWTIHWYLADTNSYYVIDEEKLIHHYTEDVLESAEQKPVEWSEEDEAHFDNILKRCTPGTVYTSTSCSISEDINWLKSIKDRIGNFDHAYKVGFSAAKYNQWKPSDEQMRELGVVATGKGFYRKEILSGLLEQLKKLREE